MIKDHQAVVKTNMAIGQFQIVHRPARQFRLGEIFQVVAPVTERAAERKRRINFVQQFIARHERVEQMPRIAELNLRRTARSGRHEVRKNFAARAGGAKGEKRIGGD